MKKGDLLKELRQDFDSFKKETGLKLSFDELEENFSFSNMILDAGYVPNQIGKVISSIIASKFRDWHTYLNGLLIPNPNYFSSQTEAKLFNSKEDKNKIWDLIKISMKISSASSVANLNEDEKKIKDFIDSAFISWKEKFMPEIKKIIERANNAWSKD